MAFGDNMKEVDDPSIKQNDPDYIQTNQKLIHEERIRNAPQIVQDYYAGKVNQFDKGLFKVLVAKPHNRVIFFVMIFCLVIVFINGNISGRDNIKVVNGYECELQAFSYDDKVFASVKIHPLAKTKKKLESLNIAPDDSPYFPVFIEYYGISESEVQMKFNENNDGEVFLDTQIFRTSTDDYDIIKVAATVKVGDHQEELSVKVSHKLQ